MHISVPINAIKDFLYFDFIYMNVFLQNVCMVPSGQNSELLELRLHSYKSPCGSWGVNVGPLLLTTEP